MSKNFDLNLLPLYRLRGNEHPSPPGLLALTPPRRKARSRARDMLLVHLILGGNAVFSTANYLQMTSAAAEEFYKTPGSVTAALRAAALTLNGDLIEQNMAASGKGRFTLATLVLGAVRGETLYLLIAGPAHVYWMAGSERRDIHDPEMAGRGLGFGQNAQFYLTQLPIRARGRLLITPELSDGWKLALQRDNQSAALETIRSVLMRQNMMDQNAVLIEVKEGHGNLQILKPPRPFKPTLASISQKIAEAPQLRSHQPEPQPMPPVEAEEAPAEPEEKPEAPQPPPAPPAEVSSHSPQQIVKEILEDAEARRKPHLSMPGFERPPQPPPKRPAEFPVSIPRQRAEQEKPAPEPIVEHTPEPKKEAPPPIAEYEQPLRPSAREEFPSSIPRKTEAPRMASKREEPAEPKKEIIEEAAPPEPPISEAIARQSARTLARGMRATRRSNSKLKEFFLKILPRLLPSSDTETPFEMPGWVMAATAIGIPLIVVTIASVVYFSMGRTLEYNQAFEEAKVAYNLALQQTDPVSERTAWEAVQEELNKVEEHGVTPETEQMRAEAQSHLDALLGILRLDYYPAVTSIPSYVKIVSMDATDTELFMLSDTGEIHRAYLVADGYQYDPDFECRKGNHGGKTIDALVAMVALPKANAMGASVMGVDAKGDLLYCASGQTPQATDLMDPPQLQGVTDIALDGDTLYLLDASVPDIWYYQGQAATFVNSFTNTFFKNPPEGMELEYAVEMAVKEGELYLLFKTGTLAHCVSSTLDTVPMRCTNSVQLVDSHLAAGGGTPFNKEIFTQMLISTPPDSALLLLAPKTQTVFRLSPRSFTLLHQLQPIEGTLRGEEIDAIATSAGHIIFVAQDNEVFMVKDIR